MTKLIIDTDIGTDVDDMLAIAYAFKAGLDVALVTTVHGKALYRAWMAKTFLNLLGDQAARVPVAAGEDNPLVLKQLYWAGVEEKLTVDPQLPVRKDGVEALAECVYANKGNISIASIAPPTNIAKAFQKHPDLPQHINHIYMMGNAITAKDMAGNDAYFLNYRSHNFKVDPHAADIIMEADVEKTIVTSEVCKKSHFTKDDFEKLARPGLNATSYIKSCAQNWIEYSMYDIAYLYDPLVIHHLIDDDVTDKKVYGNVRVTTGVRVDLRKVLLQKLEGG